MPRRKMTYEAFLKKANLSKEQGIELLNQADDPINFGEIVSKKYNIELTIRQIAEIYDTAPRIQNEGAPKMPRLQKPFIRPMLNASTAHITKKDDELLKKEDNPLSPYRYEFGYIIHIGEDAGTRKAAKEYGHSDTLLDLVDEARDRGCHFLQLDSDGEEYPELPTYDW